MTEEDLGSIIFGWVGTSLATYFYIAPIVPYRKVIKNQIPYTEAPGILLITSLLNCIMWAAYGLVTNQFSVYFANGLGGSITLIFVTIFLIYVAEKKFAFALLYTFFLIVCTVELYFLFYYVISSSVTGIAANVFNVLMYAAPGEKIYTICKTGNYKLIPIFSTIGAMACSTSWMLYGFYQGDFLLILPNALGCLSAIVQAIVYLFYRRKFIQNNKDITEEAAQIENGE